MRFIRRRPAALVAASICCATAVLAALASADTTTKPFTLTVTPLSTPYAGSVPAVRLTLRNDADPQTLGSANIRIPDGLVPDPPLPTGQVVELRDLDLGPGQSVSYDVALRIPCVPASTGYAFTAQVKQSNDFNGMGNDFVSSGPTPVLTGEGLCALAFLDDGQPAAARRGDAITADPYLPSGTRAVSVRVVDASGAATVTWWPSDSSITLSIQPDANPGGATLGGLVSVAPALGVARFLAGGAGPTIDTSATGYRLTAAASGIAGAPPVSSAFAISDDAARCSVGQAARCEVKPSNAGYRALVSTTATTADDLLFASIGAPGPQVDCPGYVESTDALLFDVTTPTGAPSGSVKTAVFTILKPVKSAPQYDVCFRSPSPFALKSLGFPLAQPDGFYVGLLPDCRRVASIPPCVTDRSRVGTAVALSVITPALDPMMRG